MIGRCGQRYIRNVAGIRRRNAGDVLPCRLGEASDGSVTGATARGSQPSAVGKVQGCIVPGLLGNVSQSRRDHVAARARGTPVLGCSSGRVWRRPCHSAGRVPNEFVAPSTGSFGNGCRDVDGKALTSRWAVAGITIRSAGIAGGRDQGYTKRLASLHPASNGGYKRRILRVQSLFAKAVAGTHERRNRMARDPGRSARQGILKSVPDAVNTPRTGIAGSETSVDESDLCTFSDAAGPLQI